MRAYERGLALFQQIRQEADPAERARLESELALLRDGDEEESGDPGDGYVPYPDVRDPDLGPKLLSKKEFARNVAKPAEASACEPSRFELSSAQKFVRNLVSPRTPYNGVMLFHGVGVGKTCTAVQVAESFRSVFTKRCYVIGPPSLRHNFMRQVHDPDKGAAQCTGTAYSGSAAAEQAYQYVGYETFARQIERLEESLSARALPRKLAEIFSDRVVVIDEAQNLRRVLNQNKGVSRQLERVLEAARNVKLVLLTATPLYDDVDELLFLMELLFLNDRDTEMVARVRAARGTENLDEGLLRQFAGRYVSYMRGENPATFPARLYPQGAAPPGDKHPRTDPFGRPVPSGEAVRYTPLVMSPLSAAQLSALGQLMPPPPPDTDEQESHPGLQRLLQHSVIVFPGGGVGLEGFDACFKSRRGGFEYAAGQAEFLANPHEYSPKIARVVEGVMAARGVVLVYSRFIKSALLPLAFALEHAGMTGVSGNLLVHGNNNSKGRYALITGDADSARGGGDTSALMAAVNAVENADGSRVKAVLISSRAAEGFDFRNVRELHVLEPWYNLSRIEQVVGRGVRNCSHAALPPEHRNCTIYLHASSMPPRAGAPRETIDLYMYRMAETKQLRISRIERVLKESALDCPLNVAALRYRTGPPVRMIDARGRRVDVQRGDQDFTRQCDYERCDFNCVALFQKKRALFGKKRAKTESSVPLNQEIDDSTFDVFFIERDIEACMRRVAGLFVGGRVAATLGEIREGVPDVDIEVLGHALERMTMSRFPVSGGHLVHRGGQYLLQPAGAADVRITRAERVAAAAAGVAKPPKAAARVRLEPPKAATRAARTAADVAGRLEARATEVARAFPGASPKVVMDHVLDHMDREDLVALARGVLDGSAPRGPVVESLERSGVLVTPYFLDYFTGAYRDAAGEELPGFTAARTRARHLATVAAALPRTPHVGLVEVRKGRRRPEFKIIHVRQKDHARLAGVVCASYPQLKNAALAGLVRGLQPQWDVGGAARPTLCVAYELALREKGTLLRPAQHRAALDVRANAP